MSVLGIDVGTSSCVLATIQRGAITIIRNDLSERLTPSLVGFTDKERLIGEEAQSQMKSNFSNTCRYIKQIMGCSDIHSEDLEVEKRYSLADISFGTDESEGQAGYRTMYKAKEVFFSATRIMAALLTKLKSIAEKATNLPVYDVVISVPGWFSNKARQAMIDAATIAGLRCLRTMNEHAAVALDYGMFRSNTFDSEQASYVAFIGIGHGMTSVSIVEFLKGKLRILAAAYDKQLGGRDIDFSIMKYFAEPFVERFGVDPLKNRKSFLKLEEAATKAKKVLSANLEAPFNIECVVDEYDINGMLTRQQFEELCIPYQQKLLALLDSVFVNSGIKITDIHQVELIGGCSRIPCFQKTLSEFFENRLPLSKTISMDETVARGCALQAAMLNPRYRVREFSVVDRNSEEIDVAWPASGEDGTTTDHYKSSVLFEKGCQLGSVKWLTFQRDSRIEVKLLPNDGTEPLVARIEPPTHTDTDSNASKRIKVKALLSHYGIASWEDAQLLVDEEVEEVMKEKKNTTQPEQPTDTPESQIPALDKSTNEEVTEYVDVVKKKIKTKRFACKLETLPRRGYLTDERKLIFAQEEAYMVKDDLLQQETKEAMNELESYIYNLRDKIEGKLKPFASQSEHETIQELLNTTQDWVYDHQEATREEYEEKLNILREKGQPLEQRYAERQGRQNACYNIFQVIQKCRNATVSPDYAHVEPAKMQSLLAKVADIEKWLNQVITAHESMPLYQNPMVLCSTLYQEAESLENFSKTILTVKPETSQANVSIESDPLNTKEKKHQDNHYDENVEMSNSQDKKFQENWPSPSNSDTLQSDTPMQ